LFADTQLVLKMPATRKRKALPELKIFHARMVVTRAEEWWVEADSPEQAEAFLSAGKAHRHTLGEMLHVELDEILVEDVLGNEEE
jgi:hypothetical protein